MKKYWQATIAAIMFLIVMVLGGCAEDKTVTLSMPPNTVPISDEVEADKMTVDVYWDATVSMQGFTRLAAGNVYRMLPDILGGMMGFPNDFRFFSFGEQVMPLAEREYRYFGTPEPYTENVTSFGNVLDVADPDRLSVVITDLFESDADWSNVTQKLRDKYFSRHLTVAIIGIKNSFYGDIFDVGLNAAKFHYNSGDNSARFRPFYLFLMGPDSQVRTFLKKWESQAVPEKDMNFIVFSEHFVSGMNAFRITNDNATKTKNLFRNNTAVKVDDRLQEMGIGDRKKLTEITLHGKFNLYADSCTVDKQALKENVKLYVWDEESVKNDGNVGDEKSAGSEGNTENEQKNTGEWRERAGEWQKQSRPDNSVNFSFTDEENCELVIKFLPESLFPPGNINLLEVQVAPTRQNLTLPTWIDEWDMGNIDITPTKFDGSKTVNLKRIAESLRESLLYAARPTIAEFYLVINTR